MATSLQPSAYELVITDPDDQTIEELVTVERDGGSPVDWLARARSQMQKGICAAGDSPEQATKQLAAVLRLIADRIDPLPNRPGEIDDMLVGLVRGVEFLERDHGGKIYDDHVRGALEKARALGWGKHKIGTLGR